ncbi:MAG TPA: c-type cytochrome domain-containing protein, partial [Pirellulales bacterium]|nr:c-type cytochrome domain-containing protein [Pirellulales bacterium]
MIASHRSICVGTRVRRMASLAGVVIVLGSLALAADARGAEPVNFARDVRPLLSKNCFRCHGPDQATLQAGLRLDSREGAIKPLESGQSAIVPGKSSESELIKRVASANADERMPPANGGRALTAGEIDLLRRWIEEGAEYKSHWAFAPPQPIAPPQVARPEQ